MAENPLLPHPSSPIVLDMTKIQNNPSNELQSVTANLTLNMMSKIEFQPDFWNPQMLSFPNMYDTMGSKMDGLAVRQHFRSKNAEKNSVFGGKIFGSSDFREV